MDAKVTRSLDTMSLKVTSVSSLPQPLYDCHAAVRGNAEVCQLATEGKPYEVAAPKHYNGCMRRNKNHEMSGDYLRTGAIACTRGFAP